MQKKNNGFLNVLIVFVYVISGAGFAEF